MRTISKTASHMKESESKYSFEHSKRLDYRGPLKNLSLMVCDEYGLGRFISNRPITKGYEDFNFGLNTTKGSYFVKVFARHRPSNVPPLVVRAMVLAMKAGVSTPKVHRSRKGSYLSYMKIKGVTLPVCVTDFIVGKDLSDMEGRLSEKEIRILARQAALMNTIKGLRGGPNVWENSWSRVGLPMAFKERSKNLMAGDKRLIAPVLKEYKGIDPKKLPRAFVHADIMGPNIIRDKKGRLWIIDFSVAGKYPRVVDLAFMTAALLVGKTKAKTEKNIAIALEEYQKTLPLTKREIASLRTMTKEILAVVIIIGRSLRAGFGKSAPTADPYNVKGLKQLSGR